MVAYESEVPILDGTAPHGYRNVEAIVFHPIDYAPGVPTHFRRPDLMLNFPTVVHQALFEFHQHLKQCSYQQSCPYRDEAATKLLGHCSGVPIVWWDEKNNKVLEVIPVTRK